MAPLSKERLKVPQMHPSFMGRVLSAVVTVFRAASTSRWSAALALQTRRYTAWMSGVNRTGEPSQPVTTQPARSAM